jgi:hypothetical protein
LVPSFSTSIFTTCIHDFGSDADVEALFAENPVRFLDDLFVVAGKNGGEELNDCHLCAKPSPYGAELETNHSTANHDQALRHFGNLESADVGEDALLIEF